MPQQGFKLVEVPGMDDPVEFPDSMSDDAIGSILSGYHQSAAPTSDTAMAGANTRMALANVPRPANPISGAQAYPDISRGAELAAGLVGRFAKQSGQALWDTSLGSIQNAYNRGIGPAVTPEQQDASARLKGAARNAVLNYAGGMVGEELSPARPFTQKPGPMVPKLLNASGQVNPETFANLQAAEPALKAGGVPAKMTQAGVAEHVRNLSKGIDSQIAPIIKANAGKDVTVSTSQIAADLRSEITPEMQRINPGTANVIEKTAKSLEDAKTLGSLDELRQQLNDRVIATKGGAVSKQYLGRALNNVYDAIAQHAQEVRPDLPIRSLRTQQSALMKLAGTFEESAAKGQAQAASQSGLTMRQKAGQVLPDVIQGLTNPKAALAKKLIQPSTAEQLIKQAFKSQPRSAAGSLVRSVAPEYQGMSSLDLENIGRGGNPAEQAQIQDLMQRAAESRRGMGIAGVNPDAPAQQIMQTVRQQRPDLFTGQAAPMNAPPSSGTPAGAEFETNVFKQVQSDHPLWTVGQQLQEAAIRAKRAR